MFEGSLSDDEIKDILLLLNKKNICVNELIGFARAMRKISTKVEINQKVIDSCGTGGDGMNTFNISTCASFIAAACGAKVAKHGNKAITSSSGSADLLHDAGAKIDLAPEYVSTCINETNFDAKRIALLNAGLLVMLFKDISLEEALLECNSALENYLVRDKFNQYIDFTNQVSKNVK